MRQDDYSCDDIEKGNILVKAFASICAYMPMFSDNDGSKFTKGMEHLCKVMKI